MRKKIILFFSILILSISACQSSSSSAPATPTLQPVVAQATATASAVPSTEWMAPSVPDALRQDGLVSGLTLVADSASASARLEVAQSIDVVEGHPVFNEGQSVWFYALVAPFPTVVDGVTFADVKQAWMGQSPSVFANRPLVMAESTYGAMKSVFGAEAGSGAVRIVPAEELVDALWQDRPQWGIVPFESLDPKLKVLEIDGQSPIHKVFDEEQYPLKTAFVCLGAGCGGINLPVTNRDPSKLTTIVMTGVTALVRATALKMELKGVNYPGEGIRDWLLGADIAHISNEIPFAVGCPYPDAYQTRLVFCSDPKYMDLLTYVGTDVIELTGNHFEDWGKPATLHTLDMYNEAGLPYFGGGSNLADAQKPAILERNGTKFAFIGCDPAGPDFAWAREDGWPGAAPCGSDWVGAGKEGDGYEWMVAEIKKLHAEGYVVIATFQYFEYYSPDPRPWQQRAFREMVDAGATIVSGSQAHYSQAMEFDNGAFIHYGLGNLFFDQMGYDNPTNGQRTTNTRREFLDRHVFYDGKYMGTELLTAELEDWARPRPMTPEERQAFLSEYFIASGW
jgi:poly-gamma-glutamate synthesis protein (capsule biosynthesis protein)